MAPFSCYYPDNTRDVSEYSQTLFDVTMDNYIEDKYFDIAEILEGWMDDYTDNTLLLCQDLAQIKMRGSAS